MNRLSLSILALVPTAFLGAQGPLYFDLSPAQAPPTLQGSTSAVAFGEALILGGRDATGNPNALAYSVSSSLSSNLGLAPIDAAAAGFGNALYVFGGVEGGVVTNRLSVANNLAFQLQAVNVTGPSPAPRFAHAMATEGPRLIVFGGEDASGALLDDCWLFDRGTNTWSQVSGPTPPARRDHAMVFAPRQSIVYLFGGRDANGPRNDLWAFNGATWIELTNAGTPPVPRYDHAMGITAAQSNVDALVVHGGESGQGTLGDCWIYSGARWLRRDSFTFGIPAASGHHFLARSLPNVSYLAGGALGSIYASTAVLQNASSTSLGAGCAGNAGVPSLVVTDLADLASGETLQMSVAPVPGPAAGPVLGVLDLNPTQGPGLPAPIGPAMPGCDQHVAVSSVDLLTNLGGLATWTIPVPVNSTLEGLRVAAQALVPAPGVNPAGYVVSDALELRVGMLIAAPQGPMVISETFANAMKLDGRLSGGLWANGLASFPSVGGSGELGEFDFDEGTLTNGEYVFDTDGQTFQNTLRGQPITVTDGQFDFSRFEIPAGIVVRFVGSNPAIIRVTGQVAINGTLDIGGADGGGGFNGPLAVIDRLGANGGPGGGAGGDGGTRATGQGAVPQNDGQNGSDVLVPAGHAYVAQTAGTGGRGSSIFPASGLNSSLVFVNFLTQMSAAGGGGGGFVTTGSQGVALANNLSANVPGPTNPAWLGPPSAGGGTFDLLNALQRPAGVASLEFYVVGGSGGGGAASHALFTNSFLPTWHPGFGGAGGGGALVLRAGNRIAVGPGGRIDASGGSAADLIRLSSAPTANVGAPGGGGSGGSVLLQSDRALSIQGAIDATGGDGGELLLRGSTYGAETKGGDGGNGLIRGETPGGAPGLVGATIEPAVGSANRGVLSDRDDVVVMTSTAYTTGRSLPTYRNYEVFAVIGGVVSRFSDIASPALPGAGPFAIEFQAMDTATGMPAGPWVARVNPAFAPNLGQAGADGFRFRVIYDRTFGQTVQVQEVRVILQ